MNTPAYDKMMRSIKSLETPLQTLIMEEMHTGDPVFSERAAAEYEWLRAIETAARKLDRAKKPQEEADAILELRAALH